MHGNSSHIVIKNNRNLLKNTKRDKFVRVSGKQRLVTKEKYDHLVLDPDITSRLKKQNKRVFYKRLILFVISFIGLFIWLFSLK